MTSAAIGYGAKFELETSAGAGTYNFLAEITNISPPGDTQDIIDATHMQSTGAVREYIAGLIDPGECVLEMNFIAGSDTDDYIQAWKALREVRSCRITFPPGTAGSVTWTFSALLMEYQAEVPNEDKQTATLTVKLTGSYTTGTSS